MKQNGKENVPTRMQRPGGISNHGIFDKCRSKVQKRDVG